jgi:hypothetical protein
MHGRDRSVLDHRCQRGTMFVVQTWRLSWCLAVDQTLGAMRVEPQHPIAHHLQGDATDFGRLCAAASLIDHRQRQ